MISTGLLIGFTLFANQLLAQNAYGIIRDVSEGSEEIQVFDPDGIFKKIIIELDLKEGNKAVSLFTSTCGESRIPEIRQAELSAQESWLSTSFERTNRLRQFLIQGKANLEYLASIPRDQQQTNLYRTLVSVTGGMRAATGSKTLIIFSDLVEVSSVFNAEKYSRNPAAIMEDYNMIIQAFEKDSLLPDLTGFKVLLISPGKTDMHLWMSRFWSKLIMSRGGQVETRASF